MSVPDSEEYISLIPGTSLSVTSGYRNAEVNKISKKILRIALLLCACQVTLTIIAFSLIMVHGGGAIAAVRLVDLVFSASLLYLCYEGVRKKNEELCSGMTYLGAYCCILALVIFLEFLHVVGAILVLADGITHAAITLVISVVFLGLEGSAMYYVRKLLHVLTTINLDAGQSTNSVDEAL